MTSGRGRGKTPIRVVELLKAGVAESSQSAMARNLGVPLRTVQNYLNGISEPTQGSLERIAAYFGRSVAWLRGEGERKPIFSEEDCKNRDQFTRNMEKINQIMEGDRAMDTPEQLKELSRQVLSLMDENMVLLNKINVTTNAVIAENISRSEMEFEEGEKELKRQEDEGQIKRGTPRPGRSPLSE